MQLFIKLEDQIDTPPAVLGWTFSGLLFSGILINIFTKRNL